MKSDNISCINYAGIESSIRKIDGCSYVQKIPQQQKWVSIFHVDIQCQQFGHFIT